MNVGLQQTRRYILDILRDRGEATVDEIVDCLQELRGKVITPVTVRHHLHLLQQEALVVSPVLRRRPSPGRPQHVYALTEKAQEFFPTNYESLAERLIVQLEKQLPPATVNVIFEDVAQSIASELKFDGLLFEERLSLAVELLNRQGYDAAVESSPDGYLLHTRNCPYHHLAHVTQTLCEMDMRLVSYLTGVIPRRVSRMAEGDTSCSYLLPVSQPSNTLA